MFVNVNFPFASVFCTYSQVFSDPLCLLDSTDTWVQFYMEGYDQQWRCNLKSVPNQCLFNLLNWIRVKMLFQNPDFVTNSTIELSYPVRPPSTKNNTMCSHCSKILYVNILKHKTNNHYIIQDNSLRCKLSHRQSKPTLNNEQPVSPLNACTKLIQAQNNNIRTTKGDMHGHTDVCICTYVIGKIKYLKIWQKIPIMMPR